MPRAAAAGPRARRASCRSSIPTASRCSATARSATSPRSPDAGARARAIARSRRRAWRASWSRTAPPPPGVLIAAGRCRPASRCSPPRCARATSSAPRPRGSRSASRPRPRCTPGWSRCTGSASSSSGSSGIGKSEAALDLVSRGHRLVADDAVLVRRISPTVLRGRAGGAARAPHGDPRPRRHRRRGALRHARHARRAPDRPRGGAHRVERRRRPARASTTRPTRSSTSRCRSSASPSRRAAAGPAHRDRGAQPAAALARPPQRRRFHGAHRPARPRGGRATVATR